MKSSALIQNAIDFMDYQFDYVPCDLINIKRLLPILYDEQCEDVLAIEKRFQVGKGYLITNGTGTGKTLVGLGVIKRFLVQNKRNILIVVPTDPKCEDWIQEGFEKTDITITKLTSITDKGIGVRVTTYANFYQNQAIEEELFDLVIYDESHYLTQNQAGKETSCLAKHHVIVNTPRQARAKAVDYAGPVPKLPDTLYDIRQKEIFDAQKKEWARRHDEHATKLINTTKVLFLSATPFAYHKSLIYVDGTLYPIYEKEIEERDQGSYYNETTGFEKFLVENFGYRMRNNKVTKPEADVNQSLLEREFFEKMVKDGVASTRVIDIDVDYSRDFYKVDSTIGETIDNGRALLYEQDFEKRYEYLSKYAHRNFTYLKTNQTLECIKAQRIVDRVKAHLYLERKIVIFHNYNHSHLTSPFKFDVESLSVYWDDIRRVKEDIRRFEKEYAYLVNLDLSELVNVRDAIKQEFPMALEFNGTIPKKRRSEYIKLFNDPNSGHDILIVQTKAGREGISLHDKIGEKQRVMMDLGLPVAPTQAIQQEGRIYRNGTVSNAIYEYITIQTSFERSAFAEKIAQRSKTAENLAMGNLARDLETAFKEGYANYKEEPPNIWQGRGSKKTDRVIMTVTPWEKSKVYYYQRQKSNSKRKFGGIDFFATPEPLGMKMVEWLKSKPGERLLEPSAGIGSISRFFPGDSDAVMIEPHYKSASMCEIQSHGEVIIKRFEDYNIVNKFTGIVMNPPFGNSGKTAFEHLQKAAKHLDRWGGFLYCIVPNGPAMQKRLDQWIYSEDFEKRHMLYYFGELILPTCTFERAGTSVSTKIIKIGRKGYVFNQKLGIEAHGDELPLPRHIDLSYCQTTNDLFDALEELTF